MKGDRYAGQYPVEQFRKFGIMLESSEQNKSQVYSDFLPLLNSARVELLDDERSINQLCGLERRTGRFAGREAIDHAPNGHDDIANAIAMAAVNAALPYGAYDIFYGCGAPSNAESAAEEARAWRVASLMGHIARYG